MRITLRTSVLSVVVALVAAIFMSSVALAAKNMPAFQLPHLYHVDFSATLGVIILAVSILTATAACMALHITPAGLIVPGSIVLSILEGPWSVLTMLITTGLVTGLMKILARFTNLFGKRLFGLCLALSTILETAGFLIFNATAPELYPEHMVGFLVPGLLTYHLMRNKPKQAMLATAAIAAASMVPALVILAV